jgi:hypothetical protein
LPIIPDYSSLIFVGPNPVAPFRHCLHILRRAEQESCQNEQCCHFLDHVVSPLVGDLLLPLSFPIDEEG